MQTHTIKSRRRASGKRKNVNLVQRTMAPPEKPRDKLIPQKRKTKEPSTSVNNGAARRGGTTSHWSRVDGSISDWHHTEVHAQGRALMKQKEHTAAIALFENDLQNSLGNENKTRKELEAAVYSRVLLSQAHERNGNMAESIRVMLTALQEGEALEMAQGSPIAYNIHVLIAQNSAAVGGEFLPNGLASVSELKPGLIERNAFDYARICMTEASIHRQLGNLKAAKAACEEAIAAGNSQPMTGAYEIVHQSNKATLRSIMLELGEIDLEKEREEEDAKTAQRDKRAKHRAKIRVQQSKTMDMQLASLHPQIVATGGDPSLLICEMVGRVEEQAVTAGLRLFGDAERAVGLDVDRADRIHLDGNGKRHEGPLLGRSDAALDGPRPRPLQSCPTRHPSVVTDRVLQNADLTR